MKEIIPTFESYLNEAMALPDTSFVIKLLTKVKPELLKAKSDVEAAKILRDVFKRKWINIRTTDKDLTDCVTPEWKVSGGYADWSRSGDTIKATILLGKDFYKGLKRISNANTWKAFCAAFDTVVAHEYVHRYQLPFIPADIVNRTWANKSEEDYEAYLKIKQEVQAYALMAIKEFIAKNYTPADVMNKIRRPLDDNVDPPQQASAVYDMYVTDFAEKDPKTFKRFLDYIYDFAIQFEKE